MFPLPLPVCNSLDLGGLECFILSLTGIVQILRKGIVPYRTRPGILWLDKGKHCTILYIKVKSAHILGKGQNYHIIENN